MSSRNKFIIGAVLVTGWIGFWNWADSTLPEDSKATVSQNLEVVNPCFNPISDKNTLEEAASKMADEAKELQRSMLRERLNFITSEDLLTRNENKVLTEYLAYDLKKIVAEKSDAFGDAMLRNIELRPEVVKIVNKLIKNGELEPYYFKEVQQMGENLRAKFQEARDITLGNPDCFKSTLEIDKLIEEATKNLSQEPTNNGWIAKKTAEELVDSVL